MMSYQPKLTPRQRQVIEGMIELGSNKAVARELGIGLKTVELHLSFARQKLNKTTIQVCVAYALGELG